MATAVATDATAALKRHRSTFPVSSIPEALKAPLVTHLEVTWRCNHNCVFCYNAKNIAKASRWGSYADANRAIVEVWGQYDIRSDAIVVEV